MALVQKSFSDIITFSRSSNATRVGPTGLVEYAPHNLAQRSQEFDNAYWTKASITVTANSAAAPDGTVTADTLAATGANADIYVATSSGAGVVTQSFYVKRKTGTGQIQFVTADGGRTNVTQTITSTAWTRITYTETATLSNTYIGLRIVTSGDELYVWGAQQVRGPYALDYTPTTSAAVYGPRFDYDPVTLAARGLLVEEQRTNLFTYSEQFDNAYWSKVNSTVTANAATAPDGTVTADALNGNGTSAQHYVGLASAAWPSGSVHTFSIYAKKNTAGYIHILVSGVNAYLQVSLDDGSVVASSSGTATGVSHVITNAGNGYFRIALTATQSTGSPVNARTYPLEAVNNIANPVENTDKGIFIWGAQLEAGSFATSYIPTLASTVTRSADVASVNTLSPWVNQTEGTLYVEVGPKSNWAANQRMACLALADTSARTADLYNNGTYISMFGSGGAGITNAEPGVGIVKAAGAFKLNDYALSANGTAATTDTSATVPTADILGIGTFYGSATSYLNGHVRRIAFYPRRLTNAELQALSA